MISNYSIFISLKQQKNSSVDHFNIILLRMIIRKATEADIPQIQQLQDKYLVSKLPPEKHHEGFVTTPFTAEQMAKSIAAGGLYIAAMEHLLVGYVFVGAWAYYDQWPIFPYMTARFPNCSFQGKSISVENSFQYGPICIDHIARGNGTVLALFDAMREDWKARYPISGTFINQKNKRSMHVHTTKMGWEIIDEFSFNDNMYYTLAFDMSVSVLQ